jgi:tight adherence protein B
MNAVPGLAAALIVLLLAGRLRPWVAAGRGRTSGRSRRGRPRPPTPDEWAALLDAVSSEVRTGSSLAVAVQQAVRRAAPHGEFVTPTSSLASIGTSHPLHPDEAVVVHALTAAHAVGGAMAATIDAAAGLLRERAVVRGEALAHSAQARLSARVLTGVPLAFAGWSTLSSRSFRAAILGPAGLTSAAAGCIANLLGWWWMRRIVGRATA